MEYLYWVGDWYSLSALDTRALIALLRMPMNSYQVARQCEFDEEGSDVHVSNGNIQYSLKTLNALMLIQEIDGRADGPGKPSKVYKITSIGRQILGWQADSMRRQLELIHDRTARNQKHPD